MHKITILGLGTLGNQQILQWNNHQDRVHLNLIDRDIVEEKNLKQQPLYTEEDIGQPKAVAIQQHIKEQKITFHAEDIDEQTVQLVHAGVVIDCTDNLRTRAIVAKYCWQHDIPFIYGGAVGNDGMTCIFHKKTCHFADVFREKINNENCQTAGIEVETAKAVAQKQYELTNKALNNEFDNDMYLIDGIEVNQLLLPTHTVTDVDITSKEHSIVKICGTNLYQSYLGKSLAQKLCGDKLFIKQGEHTIFNTGRVLVRAENEKEVNSVLHSFA